MTRTRDGMLACEECTKGKFTSGQQCTFCDGTGLVECDHSDTDEHCCLICGEEVTEEKACRAYDEEKDKDWS